MTEPDFDQIARRILKDHADRNEIARQCLTDYREALRQVWNARGAADIQSFDVAVAKQLEADASHSTNIDLNDVTRAIKALDR